eukprot:gene21919-28963_t
MPSDNIKAPAYSYSPAVIGSHTPPFIGSHTPPFIGSHTPPFIGSHTLPIKSLFGTPNHQLLPHSPTFAAEGAGFGESMIHSSIILKATEVEDSCMVDVLPSEGVLVGIPAYQGVSGQKLLCPKMSAPDSDNTDFTLRSSGTCFGEVDFTGGADTEGADLAALYEWPMKAAASELGLSLSSLRTLCTDYNIGRWPYRKLISIANFRENVPLLEINPTKRQRLTDLLDRLRLDILDDPNVPIPKKVLNLRQCQYKRRHLEHVRMGSS